ncbi:MAG: acyl-CoA dehydrogenase family protein [Dehalococcoidia bacterium]
MNFQLTAEQERLREELRGFLNRELSEDVLAEYHGDIGMGPHTRDFMHKLGEHRFLAPSWPARYGGRGLSAMDWFVLTDELAYALGWGHSAPRPLYGVSIVGPTLLQCGSETHKQQYLPRIASGEIEFCIGYTEPEAGSDLASLRTKAVEDGDEYIINGEKIFQSGGNYADYHWLLARTDPSAPKHRGLSVFIVDLKTPGISLSSMVTLGGHKTNILTYEDVRVPKSCLVGEKNQGWVYINTALDLERIWISGAGRRVFDELVAYCKSADCDGRPLIEKVTVRQKLAQLATEVEIGFLLGMRMAWLLDEGLSGSHEASILKVFATETEQRIGRTGMEILGLFGQLQEGSTWAPMKGLLEYFYRFNVFFTIAGGTSEIQRTIIATSGLGLPRG